MLQYSPRSVSCSAPPPPPVYVTLGRSAWETFVSGDSVASKLVLD